MTLYSGTLLIWRETSFKALSLRYIGYILKTILWLLMVLISRLEGLPTLVLVYTYLCACCKDCCICNMGNVLVLKRVHVAGVCAVWMCARHSHMCVHVPGMRHEVQMYCWPGPRYIYSVQVTVCVYVCVCVYWPRVCNLCGERTSAIAEFIIGH